MTVGEFNPQLTPLTLASLEITDMYHVSGVNLPHSLIKDIIYPQARGRQYMRIGGEHDDSTSLTVTFGEEGDRLNRIYAPHVEDFWELMSEIADLQESDPVTTLTFQGAVFTDMRWELHLVTPPLPLFYQDHSWAYAVFSLVASKYKA